MAIHRLKLVSWLTLTQVNSRIAPARAFIISSHDLSHTPIKSAGNLFSAGMIKNCMYALFPYSKSLISSSPPVGSLAAGRGFILHPKDHHSQISGGNNSQGVSTPRPKLDGEEPEPSFSSCSSGLSEGVIFFDCELICAWFRRLKSRGFILGDGLRILVASEALGSRVPISGW